MLNPDELSKKKFNALTALETVIDPELGIDLVNLGLIYKLEEQGSLMIITMTFTTIVCPMMDVIVNQVHEAVLTVEGIDTTKIDITWSPPWSPKIMSRYAKIALGLS